MCPPLTMTVLYIILYLCVHVHKTAKKTPFRVQYNILCNSIIIITSKVLHERRIIMMVEKKTLVQFKFYKARESTEFIASDINQLQLCDRMLDQGSEGAAGIVQD